MSVCGKPIIVHELDRIARSKRIDALWLATSVDPADDPLADAVDQAGYKVFRGSEDDVLDRFYQLAKQANADIVVRLTGDCPLHSPELIDYVVGAFVDSMPRYSYGCNVLPPTFPDGLDVEVFTFAALEKACRECKEPLEREHVTPGIHGQLREPKPEILNIANGADFSHLRWTLDYQEDWDVIKEVYETLYPINPAFGWMDILALMTKEPRLLVHNRREMRNESFVAQLPEYLAKP